MFDCEPGTCPSDSVCINFGTTLGAGPGCAPSQGNSPYQRSFCMANCSGSGDCRPGYDCLDLSGSPESVRLYPSLGAVLADSSGSGKVCAVKPNPLTGGSGDTDAVGVCIGDTGGQGGASSGGGTGGGGASGAGGDAGAGGGASGDGGVGG